MKLTEDINVHFYEEGEPAYYNGSASSITIIFSKTPGIFTDGESSIRSSEITALCKSADLTSLAVNKTLKISDVTYYIIDWELQTNSALTLCYLSKDRA